jgi:hypothetical protein
MDPGTIDRGFTIYSFVQGFHTVRNVFRVQFAEVKRAEVLLAFSISGAGCTYSDMYLF